MAAIRPDLMLPLEWWMSSTETHATDPPDGQSGQEEDKVGHSEFDPATQERRPSNAGRMIGAHRALKPQQVWAIRFWLDRERRPRDRALFDLAIDSKLHGCDFVKLRIGELVSGGRVKTRATLTQQKTGRPVQFESLEAARSSLQAWLEGRGGLLDDYVFPSRTNHAVGVGVVGHFPNSLLFCNRPGS